MVDYGFNQFSFDRTMLNVIDQLNFKKPTNIQYEVIPAILNGRSVIGQSYTGSGKTHAYLLPLFNQLNSEKREVQFVITSPTRELAFQLYDEVKKIIKFANKDGEWVAKLLVGGTDRKRMIDELKVAPHIIVGTPGRILDLVKDNALSIYSALSFVIDEADLMLDLGFITDVDQLLVRCKRNIQILAFSATIPQRLKHFFNKYLSNPLHIKIENLLPELLEQRLIAKRHRNVSLLIYELSKIFQPYLALIFANGKKQADELAVSLQTKGLNVGLIHGGLSPRERKRVLKEIENLRYQYIVATDLASRGIDIEGVSHVINAQLPKEEHFYIHRVGRTARANMEGTAISFYDEDDVQLIGLLEKKGINFIYSDVKNGEWVDAKPWNAREIRRKDSRVNRAMKVNPRPKKKMRRKHAAAIQRKPKRKTRRKR